MPYTGVDFTADLPSKSIYSFDLDALGLLQTGETPSSATFSLTVQSGIDATPSARLFGGAQVSGTVVSQMIDLTGSGIGSPMKYLIQASVGTSLSQTLLPWSHIVAQEPA